MCKKKTIIEHQKKWGKTSPPGELIYRDYQPIIPEKWILDNDDPTSVSIY